MKNITTEFFTLQELTTTGQCHLKLMAQHTINVKIKHQSFKRWIVHVHQLHQSLMRLVNGLSEGNERL